MKVGPREIDRWLHPHTLLVRNYYPYSISHRRLFHAVVTGAQHLEDAGFQPFTGWR